MNENLQEIFNNRAKELTGHDPWRYGAELSARTDEIECKWVREQFMWYRNKKMLDIGCGTGRHALILSNDFKSIHAVDFAEANVEICKKTFEYLDNVTTDTVKAQDISSIDDTFNVLLGIGLVQYLTEDELLKFFKDSYNLLEPGGTLILKIPTTTGDSFVFNGYSELLKSNYYSNYRNIRDIIDASKEHFNLMKIERTFTRANLRKDLETIERHENTKQNWFLFEKK